MKANLARNEALAVGNEREAEFFESNEILLRNFQPGGDDEEQMRDLVFDNAFLGRPFDAICPCKQWFGDVVLTPYIDYEPENIHVAIHQPSGRLIGYLTGSLGGQRFEKLQYQWVRKQVISLAVSLTMPWTLFEQSSRAFAAHVIFKGESERPNHPETGVHWHYQVDREFRGQGIGTKLLRRFTRDVIAHDFDRIWAEVMAYDEKPRAYFESRGWSIYDSRPTAIFGDHVDFPVEVLCIERPVSSLDVSKITP
jgi:ribosomal protein S18 acetylase RimI-like enzyme